MIWVTFAVPFESAAFRRRSVSRDVRILHTGVGADAARVVLEQALCEAEELPDRVIVSGFAGALVPGLEIAEIVVGEGIQSGGRRAPFAQADEVLATAAEKRAFHVRTGAEVVDMESAAICEVCAAAGVQAVSIRAISDGADDDLGLPPDLLENLASRPARAVPRLAVMLLTNAARRKAFLAFLRNCRRAQLALADALEKEVKGFVANGDIERASREAVGSKSTKTQLRA